MITAAQVKEIVGVAWSGSLVVNGVSVVNMAIGLNSNDIAKIVEKQEKRIASIEDRLLALEKGSDLNSQDENSDAVSPVAENNVPALSREQMAFANMPSELSDEVMLEAMQYIEKQYTANGLDLKKHAGLNKLFNDGAFREEIFKKTQANYKATYQNVMESAR